MANKLEFTEARIGNLTVMRHKSYLVWDSGTNAQRGLAVEVFPSGVKTYRAYYYLGGSTNARSITLGRYGELSLEAARKRTAEIRGQARDGFDPRDSNPRKSKTFGKLVDLWHEQEQVGRKKNRSANATKSHMLHYYGKLKDRPIATVRFGEIDDVLVAIVAAGKPHTANKIAAHIASFFRWCVKKRHLAVNPIAGMDKPAELEEHEKRRTRTWFSGDQADAFLKALWSVATELGGEDEKFIKAVMLTGKRWGAIHQHMRWEYISEDWFFNPPQGFFSKKKRFSPIVLPKLLQRVIGKRSQSQILNITEGRIRGALLWDVRKQLADAGFEEFFWHGCRHVLETRLGELGVWPHVRDVLMDHKIERSATASSYDHSTYRDTVGAALEQWSQHIEALVTPAAGVAVLR
jgi:hypothetical protein